MVTGQAQLALPRPDTISCALFASAAGLPLDLNGNVALQSPAAQTRMRQIFEAVSAPIRQLTIPRPGASGGDMKRLGKVLFAVGSGVTLVMSIGGVIFGTSVAAAGLATLYSASEADRVLARIHHELEGSLSRLKWGWPTTRSS